MSLISKFSPFFCLLTSGIVEEFIMDQRRDAELKDWKTADDDLNATKWKPLGL